MRRPSFADHRRRGFTLLEVILASAIAALLMAGLYFAMSIQFRQVSDGRDRVERSTLVRNVVQRITLDFSGCLTPITTGGATSSDPLAAISSAIVDAAATPAATTPSTTNQTDSTVAGSDTPFNVGVVGDSTYVTLFVSRLPDLDGANPDNPESIVPGDVRRISYWLASSTDGGLARQEEQFLTTENLRNSFEPDYGRETELILAPEVKSASFEYYDGTDWVDSWDGSVAGADGETPLGPPRAIAVTLQFQFRNTSLASGGGEQTKTIRHVIVLPTAAGTAVPESTEGTMMTTPAAGAAP